MRTFLKHNSLSIFFLLLFLTALVLQAFAGHADFNEDQLRHDNPTMSLGRYVISSQFGVAVLENWQSEYLQFFLYVFATVWLVQRGSPESKELDKVGPESDEEQRIGRHANDDSPAWARVGGWRTLVFSRSLGLVMGVIFLLCWGVQSIAGWAAYNSEQLGQHQDTVSWVGYLAAADFWNRTFQNWQSEMLAVGSMAVLSVYLRQRGSPESKPVGAAHDNTGQTG